MRKFSMMVGALALGVAVVAQAATPQQVVETRQKNFKAMGKAMKGAGDSFKSGTPDAALIKASAATVAGNAGQIEKWFPAGTALGGAIKTSAKPEIWTYKAGFTLSLIHISISPRSPISWKARLCTATRWAASR